jgi:hypothetical protein
MESPVAHYTKSVALPRERPSFITYYDDLDRVQLFAVQPTVLASIALFAVDVVAEV